MATRGRTKAAKIGWKSRWTLAALVITGPADTTVPPSIARMIAAGLPNSRLVIAPESGRSLYWKQPEFFNRTVPISSAAAEVARPSPKCAVGVVVLRTVYD